MKISIMLESQENLSWEILKRISLKIDETRIYGLYLSDHLFSVKGTSDSFGLPVWPSLTALSIWTNKLKFGPLVNSITFRHPAQVAKMGSSIQNLSNGRLELGIGAGWYSGEHEMFGVNLPETKDRLNLLEEYIQILKGLWNKDSFSFQGEHHRIEKASMNPKPVSDIPIIVGGMASRTIDISVRCGDEWNGYYLTHEKLKKKLSLILELEKKYKKSIKKTIMVPFVIGDSTEKILNHLKKCNMVFANLPTDINEWVKMGYLGGTPEQMVEQIEIYQSMGIDHIILEHLDIENDLAIDDLNVKVLNHL